MPVVGGKAFAVVYPLALLISFGLSVILTAVVVRLARRYGFVAKPRTDRWHRRPTALLGGIAIFLATIPVFAVLPQPGEETIFERFWALLIGATLIFAIGLYDDVRGLSPGAKALGQIIAASVLLLQLAEPGSLNRIPLALITVPLILVWVVGLTNAFNLLDNMDGLAAGIAGIAALTIFGYNHVLGDHQTAVLALLVAGACGGFLVFNFNPARIFMGDCGSLLLGFVLSSAVVLGAAKAPSELLVAVFVPVAVMALPILDTTLVTIIRAAHRRPISQGGRDHLSHRLVALGLNERQAVLLLYLVSASAGVLAISSSYLGTWMSISLGGLLAIAIALFGVYLGQVRIYSETELERMQASNGLVGQLVVGGQVLYKRQVLSVLLDLVLACIALSVAYLLRYEGVLEKRFVEQFAQVLPFVIIAKLPMLHYFGIYKSIWRYTGASEVLAVLEAGTLGSVLAAVALFVAYRTEALNRSVLLLDWMLFLVLVIGSRLSLVLMRDWLGRQRSASLTRVLIVGANDTGELMVRALHPGRRRSAKVVGFLDDDPTRRHLAIHAVPVIGSSAELERFVRLHAVQEVLLAIGSPGRIAELTQQCGQLGVAVRGAGRFFGDLAAGEGAADGKLDAESGSHLEMVPTEQSVALTETTTDAVFGGADSLPSRPSRAPQPAAGDAATRSAPPAGNDSSAQPAR